jgi:hypothetical protein
VESSRGGNEEGHFWTVPLLSFKVFLFWTSNLGDGINSAKRSFSKREQPLLAASS